MRLSTNRSHPAPTLSRPAILIQLGLAGLTLWAAAIAVGTGLGLPPAYPLTCLTALLPFAWLALTGLERHGHARWGWANRVTLLRGGLLALLGGMMPFLPSSAADMAGWGWMPAVIAVTALSLDGVDGWLARRTGLSSPYGARFDMESDTLAILILSLLLWQAGMVGPWALLSGLLRPGFVAAARIWPWLASPLPPSRRRRVICMVQVAVLALALVPVANPMLTRVAVGAALGLLLFSFAVDTVWLKRHRDRSGGLTNG